MRMPRERTALALILAICGVVLALGGWAIVLKEGWLGWLLILAGLCAVVVGKHEWDWR